MNILNTVQQVREANQNLRKTYNGLSNLVIAKIFIDASTCYYYPAYMNPTEVSRSFFFDPDTNLFWYFVEYL